MPFAARARFSTAGRLAIRGGLAILRYRQDPSRRRARAKPTLTSAATGRATGLWRPVTLGSWVPATDTRTSPTLPEHSGAVVPTIRMLMMRHSGSSRLKPTHATNLVTQPPRPAPSPSISVSRLSSPRCSKRCWSALSMRRTVRCSHATPDVAVLKRSCRDGNTRRSTVAVPKRRQRCSTDLAGHRRIRPGRAGLCVAKMGIALCW
jgi:hypothetical protein